MREPAPPAGAGPGSAVPRFSGMHGLASRPSYVVLQPTTLCNLNCTYCYLPWRAVERRMPVAVAAAVADAANAWAAADRFSVVWHGGEPLAAGRAHLAALMAPFDVAVEHHVQTNATLVDDAWCAFFAARNVRVSISVDGPPQRNAARVDRAGRPAYARIARGVAALRRHGVAFSALCVVSDPTPAAAADVYAYFLDLGCDVLGVNIEEQEGVNRRGNTHDDAAVRGFWAALTDAWRRDPRIHLREVEWSLRYAAAVLDGTADDVLPRQLDPVPTVAHDGAVVLLSPELAGFTDPRYGDFSSGNVLRRPLPAILADAAGTGWVREFLTGVERCRRTCAYFGFCGGAHAANRYFETGRFDGTVTNHCRNSKMRLLEGVLDHVETHDRVRTS